MPERAGLGVLLVEDHAQLARSVAHDLHLRYNHDVTEARSPREIPDHPTCQVAVVDLLFARLSREVKLAHATGRPDVHRGPFITSGLAALRELRAQPSGCGLVVWSSAEENRRLHLLFAYEVLNVRCYCAKSDRDGGVDDLHAAITAAHVGSSYDDPDVRPYLPGPHARRISDTILRDPAHRLIWRALALGAQSRSTIGALVNLAGRTVGNLLPVMRDRLHEFDPGISATDAPLTTLVRYATQNADFFLDDTVRQIVR